MRRAAAIITDHGGRTSHAAIVSRELGLPAIVGTGNATHLLHDEQQVTVSGGDIAELRHELDEMRGAVPAERGKSDDGSTT